MELREKQSILFLFELDQVVFAFTEEMVYAVDLTESRLWSLELKDVLLKNPNTGLKFKCIHFEKSELSFYVLVDSLEDSKIVARLNINKTVLTLHSSVEFEKAVEFNAIEVDSESKDQVYLVSGSQIFLCTLSKTKQIVSKIAMSRKEFHLNLGNIHDDLVDEFDTSKRVKMELDLGPRHRLRFFKFDRQMKHFFIPFSKTIKQYDVKTKIVRHSYEGHLKPIREVVLSSRGRLMFR